MSKPGMDETPAPDPSKTKQPPVEGGNQPGPARGTEGSDEKT